MGMGALANQGCNVRFDDKTLHVHQDNVSLITATKQPHERLYSIDLNDLLDSKNNHLPNHLANLAIRNTSDMERAKFCSALMGYPADSTLIKALRSGWLHIPGITHTMISRNPPNFIETHKGHLDANRPNVKSTTLPKQKRKRNRSKSDPSPLFSSKIPLTEEEDDTVDDKAIYTKVTSFHNLEIRTQKHLISQSDATGRMPHPSILRNSYILISVFKNYIKYTPFKDRSAGAYIDAFSSVISFFRSYGHHVPIVRMDNETSSALQDFFRKEVVSWQYVPPGQHRTLLAERAIRTAKNHLISIMSAATECPKYLWDPYACDYAELTINQLRCSFNNINISAYEGLLGHGYDHASNPLGVYGTPVLVHDLPSIRGTWADHGTEGFYMGPAITHYRSHKVMMKSTSRERISDNLAWFHDKIVRPGASFSDRLNANIADIAQTLKDMSSSRDDFIPLDARQDLDTISLSLTQQLQSLHDFLVKPVRRADINEAVNAQVQRVVAQLPQPAIIPPPPMIIPPVPVVVLSPLQLLHAAPPLPNAVSSRTRSQHALATTSKDASIQRVVSNSDTSSNLIVIDSLLIDNIASKRPVSAIVKGLYACLTISAPSSYDGPEESMLNLDFRGKPLTMASALADPDRRETFENARDKEWTRLLETRNCMHPVHYSDIAEDRRKDVTYFGEQVKEKIKPISNEYEGRMRGCFGGDRTNYDGDRYSWVANMSAIKILFNSIVSTPHASLITIDIIDFYLMTELDRPEYIKVHISRIPARIVKKHALTTFTNAQDFVYFQATKSIWGLPQAGRISQQGLMKQLQKHGYVECAHTPGCYTHPSRSTKFAVVVDDFAIKIMCEDDLQHLTAALSEKYDIKVNRKGDKYLGYTISHDKINKTMTLDMPSYVAHGLKRFDPKNSIKGCESPMIYQKPVYGQKGDRLAFVDDTAPLDASGIKFVQSVNGLFQYYGIALDHTFQPACQHIAQSSAHPTQRTLEQVNRLLGYAKRYPCNQIIIKASDMILHFHADASHNSQPGAKGLAGGYHFLGDKGQPMKLNAAIDTLCKTLSVVTASAGETEYGALFMNAQRACPHIHTLEDLGHPQPPTMGVVDNIFAVGLTNDTIKAKRSKSIDLRFHWIRDRVRQGQFNIIWRRGDESLISSLNHSLFICNNIL